MGLMFFTRLPNEKSRATVPGFRNTCQRVRINLLSAKVMVSRTEFRMVLNDLSAEVRIFSPQMLQKLPVNSLPQLLQM